MSTAYSEIEDLFIPLTEAEQDYHVQIRDTDTAGNLAKGALAIAAAFYGYRWYMKRAVAEHMREMPPTASALQTAIQIASKGYMGFFVTTIAPSLVSGYAAGLVEVHRGQITDDVLREIAVSYAWELGEHINQVSAEAVVKGYQAQLNRKIPPARAQQRVLEAFGVSPRTMNSLVQVWTAEDPKISSSVTPIDHKSARAERIIRDGLKARSRTIGESEIWSVRSQAKQVTWMYQIQMGKLPEGIKRRWVTATDERVCPTCGPMDGTSEAVSKPFKVKGYGKTWAPPLHPNCRCDIVLDYIESEVRQPVGKRELVMKARPGDPYDRDKRGRFAPSEQRSAKPKLKPVAVKERTKMDPELAEALSQLQAEPKTETSTKLRTTPMTDGKLKTTSQEKLSTRSKLSTTPKTDDKLATGEKLETSQKLERKIRTQSALPTRAPLSTRAKMLIADKISTDARTVPKSDAPGAMDIPPHVISGKSIKLQREDGGGSYFVAGEEDVWDLLTPDTGMKSDDDYSDILSATEAHRWWGDLDNHWRSWRVKMSLEWNNAGANGLRMRLDDGSLAEIDYQVLWNAAIDYAIYRDEELGDQRFEVERISGSGIWEEGAGDPRPEVSVREVAESSVYGAKYLQLINDSEVARPHFYVATQADMYRAESAATKTGTGRLPGKYRVYKTVDYPRHNEYGDDEMATMIPPHSISYVELVFDEHDPDVDD